MLWSEWMKKCSDKLRLLSKARAFGNNWKLTHLANARFLQMGLQAVLAFVALCGLASGTLLAPGSLLKTRPDWLSFIGATLSLNRKWSFLWDSTLANDFLVDHWSLLLWCEAFSWDSRCLNLWIKVGLGVVSGQLKLLLRKFMHRQQDWTLPDLFRVYIELGTHLFLPLHQEVVSNPGDSADRVGLALDQTESFKNSRHKGDAACLVDTGVGLPNDCWMYSEALQQKQVKTWSVTLFFTLKSRLPGLQKAAGWNCFKRDEFRASKRWLKDHNSTIRNGLWNRLSVLAAILYLKIILPCHSEPSRWAVRSTWAY